MFFFYEHVEYLEIYPLSYSQYEKGINANIFTRGWFVNTVEK